MLNTICPFPGEGGCRAWHSASGAREEYSACVCTASHQGTGSQTCSAGATNACSPANLALKQTQVGMSSLLAPGKWPLPRLQMQQRLEMASTPPGASNWPRGAGCGGIHTLAQLLGVVACKRANSLIMAGHMPRVRGWQGLLGHLPQGRRRSRVDQVLRGPRCT